MKKEIMKIHKGDLIVEKDSVLDFEEITGKFVIKGGVKVSADRLKRVGGYLSVYSNAALPKLETVGGDLYINSSVTLDAPKLETVGGDLYINSSVTLDAPKLETIGGYLSVYSNAALPKLETVGGDLYINSSVTLDAPKLETVGGDLYINSSVTLDAPKLETIGGYLSVYSNAALPKLETVGGDLYINSSVTLDAPKLETVGGDLYINSSVTLDAPKLETIGGYLSVYSNVTLDAPKLKNKNDPTAKATCVKALEVSFKKKGLIKVDGILSWLVSRKKVSDLVVFKVKIVGKLKFSFVVQRGTQFSHGETIKQATESLRYKLSDRDTTRFKKWTLKTKVSIEDAIQAYRAITGACETGTKYFVESIKVPESLTVAKVIELTDGKYGNQEFVSFFK